MLGELLAVLDDAVVYFGCVFGSARDVALLEGNLVEMTELTQLVLKFNVVEVDSAEG